MISFIIPAHNEALWIGQCLASIHKTMERIGERYEVIVVNDTSTDSTAELAEHGGARVIYVAHRLISATRNAGAREARGDVLLFIDADTQANEEAVRAALAALRAGAAGGGCIFRFDRPMPLWLRIIFPVCVGIGRRIRVVGGCFLFCTRQAFKAAGGFSEQLYGAEDIAFIESIKRVGRFVVPKPTVVTSGRKLEVLGAWEVISILTAIAVRGSHHLKKEKLDYLYGKRAQEGIIGFAFDRQKNVATIGALMNPELSGSIKRREFLKKSAAGALMLGAAPQFVHGRSADETLRVALIGCGGRGTGAAAQALNTEGPVVLWAMADAFEDRLLQSYKTLSQEGRFNPVETSGYSGPAVNVPPERRFVGLDAYRKIMDLKEIDVVILTTPPGFRPMQFEAAVQAGKHVFMEKPVATDAPGIRQNLEVNKEAKRKGLKIGVGLNRRHSPLYEETVGRIHDGAIGRIVAQRIHNVRRGTSKYHRRQPDETELEYQVRHWYYFTWLSGDFIVEQSVHDFDVVCWMKQAYPVSAQGQGGRLVRAGKDYGQIYDHFYVEYEFADGTVLTTQHRHIPNAWNRVGEYATGTLGRASVVGKRKATIELYDGKTPAWVKQREHNSYQIEHDRLFHAIRHNETHNEADYGARSTMVAILGRMAAYSGKKLEWQKALESGKQLTTDAEAWDAPAPIQPQADGSYPVPAPGRTEVLG